MLIVFKFVNLLRFWNEAEMINMNENEAIRIKLNEQMKNDNLFEQTNSDAKYWLSILCTLGKSHVVSTVKGVHWIYKDFAHFDKENLHL